MWPIRIVRPYERLIVFRWGRFLAERHEGIRFLVPPMDQGVKVDLRERFLAVPHQTCITKDNAPISIDFLIFFQVINASDSVIRALDFAGMSVGIATTTLRAVVGDILLDDVLAKREQINTVLRVKLDEVTERWGVKVNGVEIREIQPPREVQEAMNRQMTAERIRRAVVTEAEGTRNATVTVAEGDKQAAILKAEGARQATILEAEGARQAAILRAEGFSLALDRIYSVAQNVDAKTMSLQYFDTLKSLGSSPSTKFIFPMEFTGLLRPFIGMGDQGGQQGRQ
jgi:regulator of protease activity HflC (stomatin/prohibitin superfamily)